MSPSFADCYYSCFPIPSASECGGVFTRYLLSNLATNAVLQSPAAAVLQCCRHSPVRQSAGCRVSNPGCSLNVSPGQLTMSHPPPCTQLAKSACSDLQKHQRCNWPGGWRPPRPAGICILFTEALFPVCSGFIITPKSPNGP